VRIGGFQIHDFARECNEPYVIVTLRPWIDVNSVGSLVLKELGSRYGAVELGKLAKPGVFYDFTRYRPTILLEDGIRDMSIPNTTIRWVKRQGQSDLLLMRLLEPHAHAEYYVDSVLKILTTFKAKKYILVGSMYDMVPHTRPLLVSGYGMGDNALEEVKKSGVLPITYRGPSTIANLITKKAAESGIDAAVFIVSLPQYVVVEEDFAGKARLMELLNMLYDIPVDKRDFERALEQHNSINERIENSPEVKMILPQLENVYDMRVRAMKTEEGPHLPPEIEEMLWKTMGKDIGRA
jgi:predicted ATP-grasp superfamily ATP-dependent carboligase